jgi:hypothetical protein
MCHPTILRARRLAVRALPVCANGQFDRRRTLVQAISHNRYGVRALRIRQIIHAADPFQKRFSIHGHNSSISASIPLFPLLNATRANINDNSHRGVSSNGTKSGAKLKILDVKAFAGETVPRSANEAASGIQQ